MSAPAPSPPSAPAPPELSPLERLSLEGRIAGHNLAGTTPAHFRLLSLLVVAAIGVMALLGFLAARDLTANSDRAVDSTGPVLVATQDVFASIAEADAASSAVFLSGADEDREQRRLYEVALQRATAQLEEVSRLVGDSDVDHDSIKSIAADLTTYAGIVEAARLANVGGIAGASERLGSAIDIVQIGIVPDITALTTRTQGRLDDDVSGGRTSVIVAVVVGLAAVGILVAAQMVVSRRTKRMLNVPLVVATLAVLLTVAWLLTAWVRQQDELELARDGGYESIALTAEIQTTAFRYKTLESLSLISTGDPVEQAELATALAAVDVGSPTLVEDARNGSAAGAGLLLQANRSADSTREQAATSEMLVRWDRYLDTSRNIQVALDATDPVEATALAIGPGNADFNGFNTSVESVLSDNRLQFTSGLADARRHLNWLQVAMVGLPLLAAVAALWGFELRIREYRR